VDLVSLFGTGFIGSYYVDAYPHETISMGRNDIEGCSHDILYGISTVHNYHMKEGDPFIDIDTNLRHFMKVLDANRKLFGESLTLNVVSTWFVYGTTELPAKETSPCNPTGPYSITAWARERLLESYCKTFGLRYRIIRLGNVIGIGDKKISRKKNALQYMIRELAQGREIELYKNGAIRDFIDVRDCVEAIHLVLEKGNFNEIYNIANGKGYNVRDLVEVAWQAAEYTGKINEIPVPEFHRIVQTPNMWMDVKKLKSLGYFQKHDIAQSVRELVHHYQRENEETKNS
jgi:nucleoside-diphosphate-sugar epimerase